MFVFIFEYFPPHRLLRSRLLLRVLQ